MVTYLTGGDSAGLRAICHAEDIGLMITPIHGKNRVVTLYPHWAADNGCFAQGDAFNLPAWLRWLEKLQPQQGHCRFAVAPDVLGDAAATLARSLPVLPQIRALGYRAAFVAQNGLTPATTPWGAFDVLFVGGGDGWKFGPAGVAVIAAARARGLPVHIGRVNSLQRLRACEALGADSADGTFLARSPLLNLPRIQRWLAAMRQQPQFAEGYLSA